MGYQGSQYQKSSSFVVMTNRDLYYIGGRECRILLDAIGVVPRPEFFKTTDAKGGMEIVIAVANISSIVLNGGGDDKR